MRNKLKEIVRQAYQARCQYNTLDSIHSNIQGLLIAHNIKACFSVFSTGVEFSENVFTYGMSGELPKFNRTEVYFINF